MILPNWKKTIALLGMSFAALGVTTAQQKTVLDPILRPSLSKECPMWFKELCGDETKLDVSALDAKVQAYKASYVQAHKNDVTEGTKNKDNYLRYYERWRSAANNYLVGNRIVFKTGEELIKLAQADVQLNKGIRREKANGVSGWSPIGPLEVVEPVSNSTRTNYGSNIYCVEMAPSNHNVLYAAGETGGIFKTTDKGLNWSSISNNSYFGASCVSIAVHPTDPNTVYFAFGGTGRLMKTTDGGVNYTVVQSSGFDVRRLIINPTNPSILLAARGNGIVRSTDGGANWTTVLSYDATDVDFNPLNSNTLYSFARTAAGTSMAVYKSTDGGVNWSIKTTGFPAVGSYTGTDGGLIALTAADTNRVYSIYLSKRVSDNAGVPILSRSSDGGANWSNTYGTGTGLGGANGATFGMSNGQGFYDLILEANQTNANQLITGTCSIWKSSDGGVSFKGFGGYNYDAGAGVGVGIHPDIQWACSLGTDTWVATDGGLLYSSDFFMGSTNTAVRQKGINGTEFWGFDVAWNEDMVVGGSYHNGNLTASATEHAGLSLRLGGGESGTGHMFPGRRRYAAFDDIGGQIIPETINGERGYFQFTKYPNGDGYGYDASYLINHPVYYNTLYLGNGNSFWRSKDGGLSFDSLSDVGSRVKKFAISRSNPNVIYLARENVNGVSNTSFVKSTNGGLTWSVISLPSGNQGINGNNLYIAVHPTDENKVWISDKNNNTSSSNASWGNQKIYYSIDGGTTWTNITPTTLLSDRRIADICSDGGNGIYIATDQGPALGTGAKVLYSAAGDANFVDYSTNFPKGAFTLRMKPFF